MRVAASTVSPPIPRCPPAQLFRERAYQAKLDKMSVPQLREEKASLQNTLMTARFANPKSRAWVERQLQLCNKELKSRGNGGLSPALQQYQAKLDKMSLGALRREKAQIQNLMSIGRWTPEGYELVKAKLELVVKEINSRGSKVAAAFDAVG